MEAKAVSRHALLKFIERCDDSTIKSITNDILQKIKYGEEVKPKFAALKLMNNGYKMQKYIKKKDLVFVISDDNIVITVLNYSEKSFNKIQ